MSAADILNQLKTLPPVEQAAFERLFRQWQSIAASARPAAETHTWPDFLTRLRKIYGDKVTSDSQNLINESRGER